MPKSTAKTKIGNHKSEPSEFEIALEAAQSIIELQDSIKEMEAELEEQKAILLDFANRHEASEVGPLKVERRLGKPKFVFAENATPKEKKFIQEALLKALGDYTKTTTDLDVEKINFALSSDITVQNALKANNVTISQEITFALKRVG